MGGTMVSTVVWVISTGVGLVILGYLVHKLVHHLNAEVSTAPTVVMVLVVRDQEQIIEGVLREIYALSADKKIKVYVVDKNSKDQTRKIVERFKVMHPQLAEMKDDSEILRDQSSRSQEKECVYCIDLTSPVNFRLLNRTIHSILDGKDTCLYRTRIWDNGHYFSQEC